MIEWSGVQSCPGSGQWRQAAAAGGGHRRQGGTSSAAARPLFHYISGAWRAHPTALQAAARASTSCSAPTSFWISSNDPGAASKLRRDRQPPIPGCLRLFASRASATGLQPSHWITQPHKRKTGTSEALTGSMPRADGCGHGVRTRPASPHMAAPSGLASRVSWRRAGCIMLKTKVCKNHQSRTN